MLFKNTIFTDFCRQSVATKTSGPNGLVVYWIQTDRHGWHRLNKSNFFFKLFFSRATPVPVAIDFILFKYYFWWKRFHWTNNSIWEQGNRMLGCIVSSKIYATKLLKNVKGALKLSRSQRVPQGVLKNHKKLQKVIIF